MSERPVNPPPLDYATPAPRRPERALLSGIGAVLGIVSGLSGALMLFYGVGGILWLIRDSKHADGHDVVGVVTWNLIGLVCAYVAFRWIAGAIRKR